MTALRVLHVEDDPDIREVVEVSLSLDPDVVTRSCGSGSEALVLAGDWPPDIILLDVMMPVMDGPTTLARLRENERTVGIPVVFMTARAQSRELDHFRSLGAVGVIPKPFDPMILAALVRSYVHAVNDGLDALKRVFLRRVNDDAAQLERHQSALADSQVSPAALVEIRNLAHALAGASGFYDFTEIGDAAAALEAAVVSGADASGSTETIERALASLLAQIAEDSILKRNTSPALDDA